MGLRLSLPHLRLKPKSSSSVLPPIMAASKELELKVVFGRFDSDEDGKISSEELISYFASIGDSLSKEEAERVIKDFDNNGDNLLEFKDFVTLMEEDDDGDDIKAAFEMFVVDKSSGCITLVGLQQRLDCLGDVKSYEECVAMIGAFDLDGNGVLDFHEFQQLMKGEQ